MEQIAHLCGHSGTTVTERVYRRQLRPVLLDGAAVMIGSSRTGLMAVSQAVCQPANASGHIQPADMPSDAMKERGLRSS
jgi:hypothetical protein